MIAMDDGRKIHGMVLITLAAIGAFGLEPTRVEAQLPQLLRKGQTPPPRTIRRRHRHKHRRRYSLRRPRTRKTLRDCKRRRSRSTRPTPLRPSMAR